MQLPKSSFHIFFSHSITLVTVSDVFLYRVGYIVEIFLCSNHIILKF